MKKIIAIVTIGATTAFLQVNAQETQPTEQKTSPEQEVIDERAQPEADYQHNQYGTYPQGTDTTILSQDRVEISKSELPQEVLESFENSEYSDLEIVAIYKVRDEDFESSGVRELSDEPINDPEYDNTLNEEAQSDPLMHEENNEPMMHEEKDTKQNAQTEIDQNVETEAQAQEEVEVTPAPEEEPAIESHNKEAVTQPETETTLEESETQAQDATEIANQPSDIENTANEATSEDVQSMDTGVKYEIQVKDQEEEKQTTLTFTEEGELKETSEESSM